MGLVLLLAAALATIIVVGSWALVVRLRRPRRKTLAVAIARKLATEPAELGYAATEVTFELADHSHSPGWIVQGKNADGPTVVITHGWSDSRFGALQRLPLVGPHAARVVVYDLRGHGDNTAKKSDVSASDAADLACVVRQLPPLPEGLGKSDNPGRPLVLLGYSLGAGIALLAAATDQVAADAVIAEAPYRWAMEPIAAYLRRKRLPPQPFVALAWLYLAWRVWGFRKFDRAHYAAQLRCPLLVVHGSADRTCRPASGAAIAHAAPHGRLVMLPGGLHNDLITEHAEQYGKAVGSFLDDLAHEVKDAP